MKTGIHSLGQVWRLIFLGATTLLLSCGRGAGTGTNAPAAGALPAAHGSKVRPAAVAGLFYPGDPQDLLAAVDRHLASVPPPSSGPPLGGAPIRALICPHAGYEYSGPVAASAYQRIAGGSFDTVIILAASHYALFPGVSVPATEAYETPLGRVPVSEQARVLAQQSPFVLEPRCPVQRPGWAGVPGRPRPAPGEETPETWEHAVEVQLPFLQRTLSRFKILPLVFGRADPAAVARALAPLVNDRTLVIASTDLSHYHPYDEARRLDRETLKWICEENLPALESPEAEERACGRMPILTLLQLAKLKGWTPTLLDARNSGDTAGDKSRVVGYGTVMFTGGTNPITTPSNQAVAETAARYGPAERKFLLELARRVVKSVTAGGALPEVDSQAVPASCRASKGCFVTLTKQGQLRGCIGNILPAGPLYQALMDNARGAALRDPRFPPVSAGEAGQLHIEVSVLTEPVPLPFSTPEDLLAKLQPHRDGVVLRIGGRAATFLPQVWEQLPDRVEFLEHLSTKAGCAPSAWRGQEVSISIYHVEAFEEPR